MKTLLDETFNALAFFVGGIFTYHNLKMLPENPLESTIFLSMWLLVLVFTLYIRVKKQGND